MFLKSRKLFLWFKNSEYIDFFVFTIKFFFVYFLLKKGLDFLIGLAIPGGFYSDFFFRYCNLGLIFTEKITDASSFVLDTLNYSVTRKSYHVISISNRPGVSVGFACLGYGVICFWIAFIIANKNSLLIKIFWVFVGILIIVGLNIARISLIAIAQFKSYKNFLSLESTSTF